MSEGVVSSNGSFMGIDMGIVMSTISPASQPSNVIPFDLSGGQALFPDPTSFVPEILDQPRTSKGREPGGSTNMGGMSTADMFKAISDLEQPKRPLPGTRHYGSDAAM
jgi:hypothetical protein